MTTRDRLTHKTKQGATPIVNFGLQIIILKRDFLRNRIQIYCCVRSLLHRRVLTYQKPSILYMVTCFPIPKDKLFAFGLKAKMTINFKISVNCLSEKAGLWVRSVRCWRNSY
jgi:hypothetical protein